MITSSNLLVWIGKFRAVERTPLPVSSASRLLGPAYITRNERKVSEMLRDRKWEKICIPREVIFISITQTLGTKRECRMYKTIEAETIQKHMFFTKVSAARQQYWSLPQFTESTIKFIRSWLLPQASINSNTEHKGHFRCQYH